MIMFWVILHAIYLGCTRYELKKWFAYYMHQEGQLAMLTYLF